MDTAQRGQGYNDARGEIPDKGDIPKHNGLNVDNDPKHLQEKRAETSNRDASGLASPPAGQGRMASRENINPTGGQPMVTTNCQELTGQGSCTVPLSGNSVQELQNTIFSHAQQHHAEEVKKMSPQDQANMVRRIQDLYNQKAGATASKS